MQKVWNTAERRYEWHAEGIYIDGIDYDKKAALKKWQDRDGKKVCLDATARRIIDELKDEKASFDKHHHWLEEMEHRVLLRHKAQIERVKGKGGGSSHTYSFKDIPSKYRAGILAIAKGNASSYDRGNHNTCPALQTGAVRNYREYHLTTTGAEGRATTAHATSGVGKYIYYSTSHAFSTYNYYLVTIPISITKGGATITEEVPLPAYKTDGLIKLPMA